MPGYFAGMPMIRTRLVVGLWAISWWYAHGGPGRGSVPGMRERSGTRAGAAYSYGGLFGPGVHGGWDGSQRLAEQGFVENTVNEWHGPNRLASRRLRPADLLDRRQLRGSARAHPRCRRRPAAATGRPIRFAGPACRGSTAGTYRPRAATTARCPRTRTVRRPGRKIHRHGRRRRATGQRRRDKAAADRGIQDGNRGRPRPRTGRHSPPARRGRDRGHRGRAVGAAWIVQLGISHEEQHFGRTAEAMQAVSMVLPQLSPEVRQAAVAWLDRQWEAGVPLALAGGGPGWPTPRALRLIAGRAGRAGRQAARRTGRVGDLYAVGPTPTMPAARCGYWPGPTPSAPASAIIWPGRYDSTPTSGAAGRSAAHNRDINGLVAAVRLLRQAGTQQEAAAAAERLARLMAERVHFERADPRVQSSASTMRASRAMPSSTPSGPPAGRPRRATAGEQPGRSPARVARLAPGLDRAAAGRRDRHHPAARGPRHVPGPGLRPGPSPRSDLMCRLDQPWCRADLYHIEKLTAAM